MRLSEIKREGTAVDAVYEPAKAIVGGLLKGAVGGAHGVWELAGTEDVGKAVQAMESTQQAMGDWSPKTRAGERGMENVGRAVEWASKAASYPVSGIIGLADAAVHGASAGADTVRSVQDKGVAAYLGDTIHDATDSPALATAGYMVPDAVLTLSGLKAAKAAGGHIPNVQRRLPAKTPSLLDDAGYPTKPLGKQMKKRGLTYEDVMDDLPGLQKGATPKQAADSLVQSQMHKKRPSDFVATKRLDDAGKVVDDSFALEAIRQGVGKGDVATIKNASLETLRRMDKMLKTRRINESRSRSVLDMRPSDQAGYAAMQRFSHVRRSANAAKNELDNIARTNLGRKSVNTDDVVNNLLGELKSLDVSVDMSSGVPRVNYAGSMIVKDKASQRIINNVIDLMAEPSVPNALRAHKLKRQLDMMIDYQKKSRGGLTEAGRNIAKSVRRSLNKSIREVDADYAQVNDRLSLALDAMDGFQRSLGPSIDVWSDGATGAIGTNLRKLLSNYSTRDNLVQGLAGLDDAARQLGGSFSDDVGDLVIFAKTLDDRFGATARNSFSGDIQSSIKHATRGWEGVKNMAADYAAKTIHDARGINDQAAMKALDDLIKSQMRAKSTQMPTTR
jgi:hypothetical protein